MVINEKGLCTAMKDAFKKRSTGYKVAFRYNTGAEKEIILVAPEWTAILNWENAPRKAMGLIVEHLGDLPQIDRAWHVQDEQTQTEIFDLAIPEASNPIPGVDVRRTQLNWQGYQIWQRTDNLEVFVVQPRLEDLLDNYNMTVKLTEDGQLFAAGVASRLYIKPLGVMQDKMPALNHLAKMQWV